MTRTPSVAQVQLLGRVDNPCPWGRPRPHGEAKKRAPNPLWWTGEPGFQLYPPEPDRNRTDGHGRPLQQLPTTPPDGFAEQAGACKGGFDSIFPPSHAARAAQTAVECARACVDHGDACISASIWLNGASTVYRGVRSRCWLSSTCRVRDCCWSGFRTYVRRVSANDTASPRAAAAPPVSHTRNMTDAAYEALQASKLGQYGVSTDAARAKLDMYVRRFDSQNSRELLAYLSQPHIRTLVSSPVLCVGARLGGEVTAFNALPHVTLAIGVDLNPGPRNGRVLHGNAHDLWQFKNGSFGTLFTNVLDHVLHIDRFASEAHRVLSTNGTLLVHLGLNSLLQDKWAVQDVLKDQGAIRSTIEAAGFAPLEDRPWKNRQHMTWQRLVYVRL